MSIRADEHRAALEAAGLAPTDRKVIAAADRFEARRAAALAEEARQRIADR